MRISDKNRHKIIMAAKMLKKHNKKPADSNITYLPMEQYRSLIYAEYDKKRSEKLWQMFSLINDLGEELTNWSLAHDQKFSYNDLIDDLYEVISQYRQLKEDYQNVL